MTLLKASNSEFQKKREMTTPVFKSEEVEVIVFAYKIFLLTLKI